MTDHEVDDLAPTETPGYKVGEKKTLEDYEKLDQNDESLKRWKESLGLHKDACPADDPRRVVVLSMAIEVEGRPDVVVDLSTAEAIEALSKSPVVIKTGVEYDIKIKFRVQHDVVYGLKYLHSVKRMKVSLQKTEEMLGSYGPSPNPYEKKFLPEEAPSGMMGRGTYEVKSVFIDDDKTRHLEWNWTIEIKKDWN
ncbi:immunoglobulin E-set [Syncephalis pseudoplumigaleata]|uniref:Rho GDP-dissociation inhibitor n=1 Tax=Syncephalis pseudoplumigaleata TaxID=1712513 RepID=A0A4P9YU88_9FUNG|nr:immunoglobulin E-set [Syncephalis pseudoplumigaleata]|eukprot:RKP23318.1 immunoglobulin E-set [Syncephalis pseudoplumigaleata]